jgi:hypothetical protein
VEKSIVAIVGAPISVITTGGRARTSQQAGHLPTYMQALQCLQFPKIIVGGLEASKEILLVDQWLEFTFSASQT